MRASRAFLLAAALSGAVVSARGEVFQTGATVTEVDGSTCYQWLDAATPGTITLDEATVFNVLLVGGGGAGGFCRGGGGGGGGVVCAYGVTFPAGTYTITVGAGGVPDTFEESGSCIYQTASSAATCGGASSVSNATSALYTALGGGGGGTLSKSDKAAGQGLAGATSGGNAGQQTTPVEPSVSGQGYRGGIAYKSSDHYSGGGGGAGGVGQDATSAGGGDGGPGRSCAITGKEVFYGGGGGGAVMASGETPGLGGIGGGGAGCKHTDRPVAGTDGLGGGGGGASAGNNQWAYCVGAKGGSGTVVLYAVDPDVPVAQSVSAVRTDATEATFSGVLQQLGRDEAGEVDATKCLVYLAVGKDPDRLVETCVEDCWTLENAEWSFVKTGLDEYSKYYWSIRVVNDLGVSAARTFVGEFCTSGTATALPLAVDFADGTTLLTTDGTSGTTSSDPTVLLDGNVLTSMSHAKSPEVLFDAGEPKAVSAIRFFVAKGTTDAEFHAIVDGLYVLASNDAESWTRIFETADANDDLVPNAWIEGSVDSSVRHRFFKLCGVGKDNLAEIEFKSYDMALFLNRPTTWTDTGTANAPDDPEGVTISGTVTRSPSAATVYGYVAEEDCGDDESAWAARGTRFTVPGTYGAGETFSTKVLVRGAGVRRCRVYAQAGGTKAVAQRTGVFAVRSEVFLPPLYVNSSSAVLSRSYDGTTDKYPDSVSPAFFVFDLRSLPSDLTLASLRLWPRVNGNYCEWSRLHKGRISVSYDDVEFQPTGATFVEGRDYYPVSSLPAGMTWKTLRYKIDEMDRYLSPEVELFFGFSKKDRPNFLKISDFDIAGHIREMELRTVPRKRTGLSVLIR